MFFYTFLRTIFPRWHAPRLCAALAPSFNPGKQMILAPFLDKSSLDRAPGRFADYLLVPKDAKADELLTTALGLLRRGHRRLCTMVCFSDRTSKAPTTLTQLSRRTLPHATLHCARPRAARARHSGGARRTGGCRKKKGRPHTRAPSLAPRERVSAREPSRPARRRHRRNALTVGECRRARRRSAYQRGSAARLPALLHQA